MLICGERCQIWRLYCLARWQRLSDKDKHPENKWHSIDIQEHGFEVSNLEKSVKVLPSIHIMMKISDPSMKESFFGKGTPETYSQIAGQDYDFDMSASSFDQAS